MRYADSTVLYVSSGLLLRLLLVHTIPAPKKKGYDKIISAYNNKEPGAVKKEDLPGGPSCNTTTGTPKECSLNKGAVGVGVFMFLFFLATTLMAIYVALYYRMNLITPWEAQNSQIAGEQVTEHTKHAFGEEESQGVDYALIGDEAQHGHYEDAYNRQMAREGEENRSRSAGSGSYDTGSVGFPKGDYSYTEAGK